jgi:hypothetical protein
MTPTHNDEPSRDPNSPYHSKIPALPGCAVRVKSLSVCGMVKHQPRWTVSDPKNAFGAFTFSGGSKSATYRLGTPPSGPSYYERGFTPPKTVNKKGSIGSAVNVGSFYQINSYSYYNYRLCGGNDKYGLDYGKFDYDVNRAHNSVRNWIEFDYVCLAACPSGEYRKDPNKVQCTKCTECSSNKYGAAGSCSTNAGDRKCVTCDAAPDAATFFRSTKCSSSANAVWAKCDDACSSNQVEIKTCKPDFNRICVAKSTIQSFVTDQATSIENDVASFKLQTEEDIDDLTIKVDEELKTQLKELKKELTASITSVTVELSGFKQALKGAFSAAATMTSSFAYGGNVADGIGSGSGDKEEAPAKLKSSDGTIKFTVAENAHVIVNEKVIVTADEIKATIDEIVKQTYTSISEKIE